MIDAVSTHRGKSAVFLFLQGPPGPFARELANDLERRGARILRVNFCFGDWLCWLGRPAINYRGGFSNWDETLSRIIAENGVTHLLYYNDRPPYHRVAAQVARRLGVKAIAYEFGYLRPDWITLEYNGLSAHSHFPEDPALIRRIAKDLPDPDMTELYKHKFGDEAFNEVVYNLSSFFLAFLYPNYRGDKYYNSLLNYLSYIPRLSIGRRHARRARRLCARLVRRGTPYFLAPLQMQSDYQLRANSPFRHQREFIETVIRSFTRAAPADAELVFKLHPLDNGLDGFLGVVKSAAAAAGAAKRVHAIDGGCLQTLIDHARGTVAVNSTVGMHALRSGKPLKTLGIAVFDIAGLTHQGPLDDFWRSPGGPEADLCRDFLRALAAATQVKGNFYHPAGRIAAIREIVARLESGAVNGGGAFVSPPPRLEKARAMGVPFTDWPDEAPARNFPQIDAPAADAATWDEPAAVSL